MGSAGPSGRGGHLTCELCSAAGVITIGGGFGAGFLGFGFDAAASPDDAAAVDAPSLAASLVAGDLGFGFGAARQAAALVVDASSLSFAVGLIAAACSFADSASPAACDP